MPLTRRSLLGAAALALPALSARAAASKLVRAGFQKGEPILMAAKENRALEKTLEPLGYAVTWTEFQFGPPMLEAMRVGSIDVGGVGDTPPIFAQAAQANLVYIGAQRAGLSAILLPPTSRIQSLQDLKGKRIAFGRGSSAHAFLVMALDKAGIRYDEIQPIALGPADAGAAFERGAIDAWSIWDPYIALFQSRPGVRTLVTNKDIGEQNSFFIARRDFAEGNAPATTKIMTAFTQTAQWAAQHRPEVATLLSNATGMPPEAMQRAIDRLPFKVLPMNDELVQSQQTIADHFRALNILPVPIKVVDAVWHADA